MALAIAGYALSPIDLIPDFIPVLGLLDDALLLPAAVWILRKLVPTGIYARHMAIAEAAAQQPVSGAGAIVIVAIWFGLATWLGWWLWPFIG